MQKVTKDEYGVQSDVKIFLLFLLEGRKGRRGRMREGAE
jgi:hypothetical protein